MAQDLINNHNMYTAIYKCSSFQLKSASNGMPSGKSSISRMAQLHFSRATVKRKKRVYISFPYKSTFRENSEIAAVNCNRDFSEKEPSLLPRTAIKACPSRRIQIHRKADEFPVIIFVSIFWILLEGHCLLWSSLRAAILLLLATFNRPLIGGPRSGDGLPRYWRVVVTIGTVVAICECHCQAEPCHGNYKCANLPARSRTYCQVLTCHWNLRM